MTSRKLIEKLLVGADWEIVTKSKEITVLDKETLEISITDTEFSFGSGDFEIHTNLTNIDLDGNGFTLSFPASCELRI